jgi:hypothetical protein
MVAYDEEVTKPSSKVEVIDNMTIMAAKLSNFLVTSSHLSIP